MLPKPHRLHREADIRFVLKAGRRYASPYFLLACVISPREEVKRFGFLVSKKVSNKAQHRNLVKRRMRAVVAKILPSCRSGVYCVFTARPKALGIDYTVLERAMSLSLEFLGVLKK